MHRPRGATHYQPIGWDDAFAVIADRLRALPSPDAASFYTSGRTSNEAAFLYQLMVRRLGTNNLPDCSNMCHESSGAALAHSIGIGKGSVLLEDIYAADLILVVGQNPGHEPSPDADPRWRRPSAPARTSSTSTRSTRPVCAGSATRRPQPDSSRASTSPTSSCRSGSRATRRCSRHWPG